MSEPQQKSLSSAYSLLKRSWGLFQQHWLEYITLSLFVALPSVVFNVLFSSRFDQLVLGGREYFFASPLVSIGVIIAVVVTALCSSFGLLCILHAVFMKVISLGEIIKNSLKRFPQFIILQIIQAVFFLAIALTVFVLFRFIGQLANLELGMTVLSFITIFLLTVTFAVYFVFSGYVFVQEQTRPIASLKRSCALVRGWWWAVWSYLLLLALANIVIMLALALLFIVLPDNDTVSYLVSNLVSVIVLPWFVLYFCLLYRELSALREAGITKSNLSGVQKYGLLFLSNLFLAIIITVAISSYVLLNADYKRAEVFFLQAQQELPQVTDRDLYIRGFLLGKVEAFAEVFDNTDANLEIIAFAENYSYLSGYQTGFLLGCKELNRSSERCLLLLQQRMELIAAEITTLVDPLLLDTTSTTEFTN